MNARTYIIACCAAFVAVRATLAQPQPDTIDSLARSWSGGRSTSSCKPDPAAKGEEGAVECDWLLPVGQRVEGSVLTRRYKTDSAMVIWQREMSLTEMRRVADSLNYAFQLRGLTSRTCRPGMAAAGSVDSRVWEDKGLLVHVSATSQQSAGRGKLLVIGVDKPSAYPDAICPRRRDP